MAYVPSGGGDAGGGPPTRTAAELSSLYNAATPGYGIYTYILLGKGFPNLPEFDVLRYRELLRLIQTYILAPNGTARRPEANTHTFLLAVYPWRRGQPLIEQTGPELSAGLRAALAKYVGALGEVDLAEGLATRPGPFLVSSPEPRLIPNGPASPRMIADLSVVAPEYLYPLVDAYDQSITGGNGGPGASIALIRSRLGRLFEAPADPAASYGTADGPWVFMLGGERSPASGVTAADRRSRMPAPATLFHHLESQAAPGPEATTGTRTGGPKDGT
jgi:hypothetical protein